MAWCFLNVRSYVCICVRYLTRTIIFRRKKKAKTNVYVVLFASTLMPGGFTHGSVISATWHLPAWWVRLNGELHVSHNSLPEQQKHTLILSSPHRSIVSPLSWPYIRAHCVPPGINWLYLRYLAGILIFNTIYNYITYYIIAWLIISKE